MRSENLQPVFEASIHSLSCNTLVVKVLHAGDTVQVLLLTAELLLLCSSGPKKSVAEFSAP